MNGKRPVVVTTDGSAHSHRILPHAALLAGALQTPLVLIQILDALEPDGARASAEAASTLSRLGIEGEVVIEPRGAGEKTADAILRVVSRNNAAVLAMDSRGHGSLHHALHGSVALDVLRTVNLPLLVSGPNLEPAASSAEPYRFVVTSDGSHPSGAVLGGLSSFAATDRFQVTLLRVHEREPGGRGDEEAMQACREELEVARAKLPASLPVETLVREIPRGAGVDTAVIETAKQISAHAIAMSTHGYSARRHVVMGSVAMTLLGRSPLPLLLARAEV
jgi:nucleotide-binding universal stress UspA family protein